MLIGRADHRQKISDAIFASSIAHDHIIPFFLPMEVTTMSSNETFVTCRKDSFLKWDCQSKDGKTAMVAFQVRTVMIIIFSIATIARTIYTWCINQPDAPARASTSRGKVQGQAGRRRWMELGDMEPRDVEQGVRRPKLAVGIGSDRQRDEGINRFVEFAM